MKKQLRKLILVYGVGIGSFLIGIGFILCLIDFLGELNGQSRLQFNSWLALYFTGIGVILSSINIIVLEEEPPKKNNFFYYIAILSSVALIFYSHIYELKDVVVTGLAIIGIAIGIIRPVQVKTYQEKYQLIPGELIGWGVFNDKEYQIIILDASNLFVVMEYEILPLNSPVKLHNCRQCRFQDIDSARRHANGIWQEKKNSNKNYEIFTEAK